MVVVVVVLVAAAAASRWAAPVDGLVTVAAADEEAMAVQAVQVVSSDGRRGSCPSRSLREGREEETIGGRGEKRRGRFDELRVFARRVSPAR